MIRLRNLGVLAVALSLAAGGLSFGAPAARAIAGGINGAGMKPSMGWSSWSFLRRLPTLAKMEAQADGMVSSGLADYGFTFINLDDFYYLYSTANHSRDGMDVEEYGRWVTDPVAFPPGPSGEDGMQVLGDYIHSDGLKFGIYLTPGIPRQAVLLNTPIEGTAYHAQDIVQWQPVTPTITAISAANPAVITTSAAHGLSSSASVMVKITGSNSTPSIDGIYPETYIDSTHFSIPVAVTTAGTAGTYNTPFTEFNYNQGVMYRIDFTKPGAQEYYNSVANRFASWGVDYLKFDGVRNYTGPTGTGPGNVPDLKAMSAALIQTGRPIVFDTTQGNQAIGIAPYAQQYASQTVFFPDIESSATGGLTSYASISTRFDAVSQYAPFVGPGFHMDCDSVEIGSGQAVDGINPDEQMTEMSLWALESSAWILGPDLTNIDPGDFSRLTNTDVIAVDQDDIAATQIANSGGRRVFSKLDPDGTAVVGLFNTNSTAQNVSTTAAALGLPASSTGYALKDLWTKDTLETAGVISAAVPSHGVALYRVRPISNPSAYPPSTTLGMGLPSTLVPGQTVNATVSFTNNGVLPAQHPKIGLGAPVGWKISPSSASFGNVGSGQTVPATFKVTAPATTGLATLNAAVTFGWTGGSLSQSVSQNVTVAPPVKVNEFQLRTTSNSTSQFVELFNAGTAPIDVGGWKVVYRSSSGATDTTLVTIPAATTLPAGGFYLIGRSGNGTTTGYLGSPPPNQTFTTSLSTSSGGVGIRDTTGLLVDSVGYGSATNILVEGTPTPAPPNTATPGSSSVRQPDGQDTDLNVADFTVSSNPTPGGPNQADAHVWIGLKNGDDQGAQFDLQAELLKNGTTIATGIERCISGVTRNPASAKEAIVPWGFSTVPLASGDVLAVRFSARIGTNPDDTKCAGHGSATGVRLYYDAASFASHFAATIGAVPSVALYLHSDGAACMNAESAWVTNRYLNTTAPGAVPAKCKDSGVVNFAGGNNWSTIGTWSLAPLP